MAKYGQPTGELNQGALGFNNFYARSFYVFLIQLESCSSSSILSFIFLFLQRVLSSSC